jgi:hypothetical protein
MILETISTDTVTEKRGVLRSHLTLIAGERAVKNVASWTSVVRKLSQAPRGIVRINRASGTPIRSHKAQTLL